MGELETVWANNIQDMMSDVTIKPSDTKYKDVVALFSMTVLLMVQGAPLTESGMCVWDLTCFNTSRVTNNLYLCQRDNVNFNSKSWRECH